MREKISVGSDTSALEVSNLITLSWDFMCKVTNSFSSFFEGVMLTIFALTGLCAMSIILYVLGARERYAGTNIQV
jgi:hypothetical protein